MIRVLQSQKIIEEARNKLAQLGADSSRGWRRILFKIIYFIRYRKMAEPVALNKSWDTLSLLEIVMKYYPDRNSSIYDMGSYNCEIPLALWSQGYHHIRASDLNPKGRCLRFYGNNIDFHCEDFYRPQVPDGTFHILTCVSVVEHGFNQDFFLQSVSRLLRPEGILLLTTDYHPQKIKIPEDFKIFNLSYLIFSQDEIKALITRAQDFGLSLLGDEEWGNSEYPISFSGHQFTFILLAFRKNKI